MTTEPYYSIGEVLNLLKLEHPDLTLSRIRTLERKGLVEPERTPSGYRKFTDDDVERLRRVLTDHGGEVAPADPTVASPASVSMTAGELAAAVDADRRFIGELTRLGLLVAIETDTGAVYDDRALVIAKAAARLHGHGFQARHLRMYKVAADSEVGVLRQLLGHKLRRSGPRRDEARADLADVVMAGESLRRALIRRNMGADVG